MSIGTKIVLVLIVLHLILGFGWLMYKLSPRKRDDKDPTDQQDN